MSLYHLNEPTDLVAPTLIAAIDGWVDSGSAATTAAERLADHGEVVVTFDGDQLFDFRARRPTLDIVDGRLSRADLARADACAAPGSASVTCSS